MHILYIVECLVNRKLYVGITSQPAERRWQKHLSEANIGNQCPLYHAIRKYGAAAFTVTKVDSDDSWEKICEKEREAIAVFGTMSPNGFNLTAGGEGATGTVRSPESRKKQGDARRGMKHSDEAKRKMRESQRRRIRKPLSAEAIKKIADAGRARRGEHRGPLSAEHREAISKGNRGHAVSVETRQKIGAIHRGKVISAELRQRWSMAQRGRSLSIERRDKISAGLRRHYERKRALSPPMTSREPEHLP